MKTKKILSLVLAGVMALALAVPAFAEATTTTISTSGDSAETQLKITAAASQLNVTVPTSLLINVDTNNVATVGKGHIVNNSNGVVEVKSITLTNSAYTLETYSNAATFNAYEVGSKKLGLSIGFGGGEDSSDIEMTGTAVTYVTGTDFTTGTAKTPDVGTLKIAAVNDATHNNKLYINPSALVSPNGAAAVTNATAATMTIVVGWYTGS